MAFLRDVIIRCFVFAGWVFVGVFDEEECAVVVLKRNSYLVLLAILGGNLGPIVQIGNTLILAAYRYGRLRVSKKKGGCGG